MNHTWGVKKESRERRAKIIEHILSMMANMYLCNDMEMRYDILSMFYTFETTEDPTLVEERPHKLEYTTGFMQDFLQMTRHRKYIHALTSYIKKNGHNLDRLNALNPDEVVIDAAWVMMKVHNSPEYRKVLLVFSNRSFYRFEEPLGWSGHQRQDMPELMCPGGPEFAFRYDYDQVGELYRGCDGSGFRLVYYRDTNKSMSANENFIVYDHGALDRMLELILRFAPNGTIYPKMVCEQWTVGFIHDYFDPPKESTSDKDQKDPETIEMVFSFLTCNIQGNDYPNVMVVLSTHQKLYFYHTNYTYWMCDNEEDNDKFLEHIPGVDPIPVDPEWKIDLQIASEAECPSIMVTSKAGGRRTADSGAKVVFKAYFSAYTTAQMYYQGLREARHFCNGKTIASALTDLLT